MPRLKRRYSSSNGSPSRAVTYMSMPRSMDTGIVPEDGGAGTASRPRRLAAESRLRRTYRPARGLWAMPRRSDLSQRVLQQRPALGRIGDVLLDPIHHAHDQPAIRRIVHATVRRESRLTTATRAAQPRRRAPAAWPPPAIYPRGTRVQAAPVVGSGATGVRFDAPGPWEAVSTSRRAGQRRARCGTGHARRPRLRCAPGTAVTPPPAAPGPTPSTRQGRLSWRVGRCHGT